MNVIFARTSLLYFHCSNRLCISRENGTTYPEYSEGKEEEVQIMTDAGHNTPRQLLTPPSSIYLPTYILKVK